MKNTLFTFLLVLLIQSIFAQATPSTIDAVTVFRQNAEITRKAHLNLKAGKQEIVLSGLSVYVNPTSLQVKMNKSGVTLLSAKYLNNYLQEEIESPEIIALREELEVLSDDLGWLKDQESILENMESLLKKNQELGGRNEGFTATQVTELVNAHKAKYLEIKKEKIGLKKQSKAILRKSEKIRLQLQELNAKSNRPSGNIVLTIQANASTSVDMSCSYIVSQAGWNPLYDLRSEGIDQDVQLLYKGNIYQHTGQDWKNVQITVSTGNPTQNNNRPILSPLFAAFQVYADTRHSYAKDKKVRLEAVIVNDDIENSSLIAEAQPQQLWKPESTFVNTNQITVEYELPGRHDIKADRKENLLALKTYKLATEYIYHVVPKLDKGAFLLAKISDWGQYNIETGKANIFFEGAYVGETYIDSDVTASELLVSMGRDKSIVVSRKQINDFSEKKILGTKQKETFAYDITVKNKKSTAINIEVLDQVPVSTNKKIVIKLEEKGSAELVEENGRLLWTFELPAGQSKKERFVYSVKYPKNQSIRGIR